jgi:hypothetical protein
VFLICIDYYILKKKEKRKERKKKERERKENEKIIKEGIK